MSGSGHAGGVPLGDHFESRELQMTEAVVLKLLVADGAGVDIACGELVGLELVE
jgi:hypothetical protein